MVKSEVELTDEQLAAVSGGYGEDCRDFDNRRRGDDWDNDDDDRRRHGRHEHWNIGQQGIIVIGVL